MHRIPTSTAPAHPIMRIFSRLACSTCLTLLLAPGDMGASITFAASNPVQPPAALATPENAYDLPGNRSGGCVGLVHVHFPLSLRFLFDTGLALRGQQRLLVRMQALASKVALGALTAIERAALDAEYQFLIQEMDRSAAMASFNGIHLLDGSGDVCLEGRPPAHMLLFHDAPDTTPTGLNLQDTNIVTVDNARTALLNVSSAIRAIEGFLSNVRWELRGLLL